MIHCIGQGQIIGGAYPHLVRDGTAEDGLVEHLMLPRNMLATLAMFGPEPEQLLWRHRARNPESIVVKCQADDVRDDTEHRVVIETESVCLPAESIRVRRKTHMDLRGQLTVVFVSDETWSLSVSHPALEHVDRPWGPS